MLKNEDFWRTFVNSLDISDGPTQEELQQQELMAKDAAVLRLRFDLYLISPLGEDSNKAYMVNAANQMEDMGVMTIKEALKMIQSKKKKKS